MKLKVILWLFGGLLVFGVFGIFFPQSGCGPSSEMVRTQVQIYKLQAACKKYTVEYGMLPASSENYVLTAILCGQNSGSISFVTADRKYMNPNKELVDGWNTPFRIVFHPKENAVSVLSAGDDRLFYTEDDLNTDREK